MESEDEKVKKREREMEEIFGIPRENYDWGIHQKRYEELKASHDRLREYLNTRPIVFEWGDDEDEEYIYKSTICPNIRIGPGGEPVEVMGNGYTWIKKDDPRILNKEQAEKYRKKMDKLMKEFDSIVGDDEPNT